MKAFVSPASRSATSHVFVDRSELDVLLAPLYQRASSSPSLLVHRQAVSLDERTHEIPRFLLLGQRGGGKPIRLALLAGLDAGVLESTAAVARILMEGERSLSLARDFALFAYPIANVRGFMEPPETYEQWVRRAGNERPDADVAHLRGDWQHWAFEGVITLRVDPVAEGFYANVRSAVIAQEVAAPSLATLAPGWKVASDPVRRLPGSPLGGWPRGQTGAAPSPFEVEIFAPGSVSIEQRVAGLVGAFYGVLRHYRHMVAHAANL